MFGVCQQEVRCGRPGMEMITGAVSWKIAACVVLMLTAGACVWSGGLACRWLLNDNAATLCSAKAGPPRFAA